MPTIRVIAAAAEMISFLNIVKFLGSERVLGWVIVFAGALVAADEPNMPRYLVWRCEPHHMTGKNLPAAAFIMSARRSRRSLQETLR